MESKLIKNLYFAGEVIDVDAETGGYNTMKTARKRTDRVKQQTTEVQYNGQV